MDKTESIGEIAFKHKEHGLIKQSVHVKRVTVMPPKNHPLAKTMTPIILTTIYCKHNNKMHGKEDYSWRLVTSIQTENIEEILEIVRWYTLRWDIEIFLKS